MGKIGPGELVIILIIVLIVFGANRLPDLAKSFGRSIREFKSAVSEKDKDAQPNGNDKV